MDTDYVRIGTEDSTRHHPGETIQPTSDMWAEELTQVKISHKFEKKSEEKGKAIRIPNLSKAKAIPIELKQVDVVIMNPPFTSQNNLSKEYKNSLKRRFSMPLAHKETIYWKTSQQLYFILLADRFLKKKGTMAAVLPFTTFTGHAFQALIKFLVKNYTIKVVVVGLGQSSFSEDTSLTECLFVAKKEKPKPNHSFKLIGTKISPSLWTSEIIRKLGEAISNDLESLSTDVYVCEQIPQNELLPEGQTLSLLYMRLIPEFNKAWETMESVFSKSSVPTRKVKKWFNDGLTMDEVYHGEDRPLRRGPKAIIMCRNLERAQKESDRLVLKNEDKETYTFYDRFSEQLEFNFPKLEVTDALRRFSYLNSMDITGKTDFCVKAPEEATKKAMKAFYSDEKAESFIKRLSGEKWQVIQKNGSSNTSILARANLAAPGTKLIAAHADYPYFLAGAYGYIVRGFKDELEEKLFVLWMNSTIALLQLIGKSTITQGAWVKLEEFTTEQVVLPDCSVLTVQQKNKIEEIWRNFSKEILPSLMEQLNQSTPVRLQLDIALLELLGTSTKESEQLARTMEKGALKAIQMLRATMKKPPVKQKKTTKPKVKTLFEFSSG